MLSTVHAFRFLPLNLPRRRPPPSSAAAKPRRRNNPRSSDIPSWDSDGDGDEVALPAPVPPPDSSSPVGPPSPELRGSDVLRALQRAVAAKEASRRARKQQRRADEKARVKAGEGGATVEVRPIQVKEEWRGRIEVLERRVEELMRKY